jgi:hypothetical protein
VTHPSLGLPPPDTTAAFPAAAARIRAAGDRLAARALEIAIDRDPTFHQRYDEIGLRRLLRDLDTFIDRLAFAVATGDPHAFGWFVDQTVPIYRRRAVPMDDLAHLFEGLRGAIGATVVGDEGVALHAALDDGIAQTKWNRRIAGDARKRNRLLQFLYKGA